MALNIFTATRTLTFVGKLFAAAKLNLDEFVATGDETALQAHIAAQIAAAAPATPAAPAVATLPEGALSAADATALRAERDASRAEVSALRSALNAAGVKFGADAKPEQLAAALEARISTRAGEELAKRGVGTAFVADAPAADPASAPKAAATEGLTGLARTVAALKRQAS